jgi:ABC-2 type transport system permease protein
MQGITTAFFEDVWSRNFLNIFASPLLISEYVTGLVVSSIATSALGLMAMLILATAVFGLSIFVYGLQLLALILVLFLFGVALGVFACAIVLRLGPASEWLIWPIPALLSPLSCVFYPLSSLPVWMQYVARLLPPSWVFETMRKVVTGSTPPPTGVLWGGGLALAYVLLAGWTFAWVHRYAVRSGLIARYSAESVS